MLTRSGGWCAHSIQKTWASPDFVDRAEGHCPFVWEPLQSIRQHIFLWNGPASMPKKEYPLHLFFQIQIKTAYWFYWCPRPELSVLDVSLRSRSEVHVVSLTASSLKTPHGVAHYQPFQPNEFHTSESKLIIMSGSNCNLIRFLVDAMVSLKKTALTWLLR